MNSTNHKHPLYSDKLVDALNIMATWPEDKFDASREGIRGYNLPDDTPRIMTAWLFELLKRPDEPEPSYSEHCSGAQMFCNETLGGIKFWQAHLMFNEAANVKENGRFFDRNVDDETFKVQFPMATKQIIKNLLAMDTIPTSMNNMYNNNYIMSECFYNEHFEDIVFDCLIGECTFVNCTFKNVELKYTRDCKFIGCDLTGITKYVAEFVGNPCDVMYSCIIDPEVSKCKWRLSPWNIEHIRIPDLTVSYRPDREIKVRDLHDLKHKYGWDWTDEANDEIGLCPDNREAEDGRFIHLSDDWKYENV